MPTKFLTLILGLLILTSCSTRSPRVHTPPMPPMPQNAVKAKTTGPVQSPKGREMFKLTAAPVKQWTNSLTFAWDVPNSVGVTNYNFYFGTNTGKYASKIMTGNTNGYVLVTITQLISTNPAIRIKKFPNGSVFTNTFSFYYVVSALYDTNVLRANGITVTNNESPFSNEVLWPPPPPPPWTAIILSWGTNSITPNPTNSLLSVTNFVPVMKNVTVQQKTNLLSPTWLTVTNVTGTNVVFPLGNPNTFYRLMTTNQPPLTIRINGGYL